MSAAAIEPDAPEIDTFEDLHQRLGEVPLSRIRWRPYPGTAREGDVLAALKGPRKRICELVDGVLVEKPVGYRESMLAIRLAESLNAFVRKYNLGIVSGEQGMLRLAKGAVRAPDVAFVSWDRIPERKVPTEPIPGLTPDLAIEVLSDSNTKAEMERKRHDYFDAGTKLVWEVDPDARTVAVFESASESRILTASESLAAPILLPGFAMSLADLFAELDRQG